MTRRLGLGGCMICSSTRYADRSFGTVSRKDSCGTESCAMSARRTASNLDRYLNNAILPRLLRVVHGLVGSSQEVVGAGIRGGTRNHADARGNVGRPLEHTAESDDQALRCGVRKLGIGLGHEHRELVAPEPPDDVRLTHRR